ncbi:MAG TPA: PGF-CTERM sorting domain-containing protein [Candidatus Methanoperedens sp.]
MNKISRSIAIVLVLTILSLPVLGEMNGGSSYENSMDAGRNDSSMMNSRNNDISSMQEKVREMYDNGSRMRDVEGMMGMGFMHQEDDNYGNYVTFSVDNTTGDVLNFGILGISVFDSIKITGFDFRETRTEGAETKILNKDGSIVVQIHDNPAAVIEIEANKKATLNFKLATGASAAKQDNIVKITAGNITAYIVSEKASSINIAGSQVSINTDIGGTIFRASPVNMPHDDMEDKFMGEMMTKRAGAEISVGKSDKYSIVNYSENVNVTVDSIETDRMRMMIDSSDSSGKFILMNIDNSSLKLDEGQKISLYLDNKPMKQVSTEQELYNTSESSFWLGMNGRDKMQMLAYISKFSTHQLDVVVEAAVTPAQGQITTTVTIPVATTAPAKKTPGFEIALGVLSTVAAAFIMRRKP